MIKYQNNSFLKCAILEFEAAPPRRWLTCKAQVSVVSEALSTSSRDHWHHHVTAAVSAVRGRGGKHIQLRRSEGDDVDWIHIHLQSTQLHSSLSLDWSRSPEHSMV